MDRRATQCVFCFSTASEGIYLGDGMVSCHPNSFYPNRPELIFSAKLKQGLWRGR